ncbi:4Fe-4S dicluster domain-containing protein [Chloroflexota bacterium]
MAQYGFFFDQSRCSGCRTCTVACKAWNNLPPGPLKYLRVYEYEKGSFPNIRIHVQWVPCYHCEEPACVSSCPCEAIYKEPKYGAVLIDSEKCNGCRICYEACPYGALVFENDSPDVPTQKCNMCIKRLETGLKPICVLDCPLRALDFGPLEELTKRYGDRRDIEDMPSSEIVKPAIIFQPHHEKKQLVPYHSHKALSLLMRRDPLPPAFDSTADVTNVPEGIVGRSRLVIKAESEEELMRCTRNDEG